MRPCPSREALRSYLTDPGSLGARRCRRIELHLEGCERCQRRLDRSGDEAPLAGGAEALSASGVALLGLIKRSVPRELEEVWGPGGALKGLARALDPARQRPAGSGRELAEALRGLEAEAGMALDRGRHAEAERLYRKALVIRAADLPPGHPGVARGFERLAMVRARMGRHAEAEPLLRLALLIRASAMPAGHPDVARSLINLAAVAALQGRYSEAATLYREALGSLPADHPDAARGLRGLASALRRQGRHSEAEPLARRARELRAEARRSPDEPTGRDRSPAHE